MVIFILLYSHALRKKSAHTTTIHRVNLIIAVMYQTFTSNTELGKLKFFLCCFPLSHTHSSIRVVYTTIVLLGCYCSSFLILEQGMSYVVTKPEIFSPKRKILERDYICFDN